MNYLRYQKNAEKWAKKAGAILLEYRNKIKIKERKRDYLDLVTNADLASEEYLIKQIQKAYPEHNIYSEELGKIKQKGEYTWVIDPLDGTKEYVRGLPIYNISIALEFKGKLIMGVVYRPRTDELFSCSKGNGAYLNGEKITVSVEDNFKNCFIWTHLPSYKNTQNESKFTWLILEKLAKDTYRLRPFSEDVASLCWLAMGGHDGYILTISAPKWWDVAAGLLMVEEAGGKVTDMYGSKIKNRDLSKGIVASNGKIHNELLGYLNN